VRNWARTLNCTCRSSGQGAPLSATSLRTLKEKWEAKYENWKKSALEESELAYLRADGIYVKAALSAVIGVLRGGRKKLGVRGELSGD